MTDTLISDLQAKGWTLQHNGGGTCILRKGQLILSGYDGDLPADHWFMVAFYADWDAGDSEPIWSLSDGTAEWADCGPAIELSDAIEQADAVATKATLAAAYVEHIGYDPFVDCHDISAREVAHNLEDWSAASGEALAPATLAAIAAAVGEA